MKSITTPFFLFAILSSFLPGMVYGAGFQLPEQGIAAMGQANAFVAQADDPSAVYYNPAGILQLEGTQTTLGTTLISTSMKFTNTSTSLTAPSTLGTLGFSGKETDAEDLLFVLPHLYVTHRVNDRWGLGLGLFSPFGLATEWPQDWEGRFVSYQIELGTMYVNPVVAFSPSPGLTFSAGLQYVYSTVELKRRLDLSPLGPLGEGNLAIEDGSGDGWGYNFALLVKLNEQNTLGAAFRSQVNVDYEGDAKFSVPPIVAALFPDGPVRTDVAMPSIFEIGLANRSISDLTLSFDLQWVGWSSISHLSLDFENNTAAVTDTADPRNWNDTLRILAGAEYALTPNWDVRLGYVWDPTPVPPETLDTLLPDNNRHDVSVGAVS